MRHILLLLLAAAGVWAAADGAAVSTYLVKPDGTGDFPTIRAAVQAVHSGDIIELADGIFQGPDNRNINFLGKLITIRSQRGDPARCVIDCQGAGRGFVFDSGELPQATLEGVTVAHGYSSVGSAVICANYAMPTLKRCVFSENVSTVWAAGVFCSVTSPTIIECLFINNTARYGGGVLIAQGSPLVSHCTFVANEAYGGGGVFAYGGSTPHIDNCTFVDGAGFYYGGAICCIDAGTCPTITNSIMAFSTAGSGVHCQQGAAATLSCCDIFGNAGGDWVGCIAGQYGLDNISLDPQFCDAAGGDFRLWNYTPCVSEMCGQVGALAIGCYETSDVRPGDAAALFLSGARPNPFTRTTCIAYAVPAAAGRTLLQVFDPSGRLVRTLVDGVEAAGAHVVTWDGASASGERQPSGIYYYQLSVGGEQATRRVILLR